METTYWRLQSEMPPLLPIIGVSAWAHPVQALNAGYASQVYLGALEGA